MTAADAARAHFVAVRDGKSKLAVVQLGIMLVHCSPDIYMVTWSNRMYDLVVTNMDSYIIKLIGYMVIHLLVYGPFWLDKTWNKLPNCSVLSTTTIKFAVRDYENKWTFVRMAKLSTLKYPIK